MNVARLASDHFVRPRASVMFMQQVLLTAIMIRSESDSSLSIITSIMKDNLLNFWRHESVQSRYRPSDRSNIVTNKNACCETETQSLYRMGIFAQVIRARAQPLSTLWQAAHQCSSASVGPLSLSTMAWNKVHVHCKSESDGRAYVTASCSDARMFGGAHFEAILIAACRSWYRKKTDVARGSLGPPCCTFRFLLTEWEGL